MAAVDDDDGVVATATIAAAASCGARATAVAEAAPARRGKKSAGLVRRAKKPAGSGVPRVAGVARGPRVGVGASPQLTRDEIGAALRVLRVLRGVHEYSEEEGGASGARVSPG